MGKVARKQYTAEFKAKVALEAIRGELALAELVAKHGFHQTMIAAWKKQAVEGMAATFSGKAEAELAKLHAKRTGPPLFRWNCLNDKKSLWRPDRSVPRVAAPLRTPSMQPPLESSTQACEKRSRHGCAQYLG
jgi:transposase